MEFAEMTKLTSFIRENKDLHTHTQVCVYVIYGFDKDRKKYRKTVILQI